MEKVLFEGEWKETFNAGLAVRQEKILEQLKKVAPIIWDREEKEGRGLALSADREGRISYAQSKTSFDDDNRRATTTLQRYVRRQLKLNTSELADHKLNSVCQEALKPFTYTKLEAVSGTAIAQAYHEGFGNTSCMTGGSISSIKQLLSLYVENPEKIQLAKYYYGSSQARALIWHVAEGEIFIDRIYSNIVNIREDFISEIKNLYKDKTVHLREHNNLPCGEETFKSFCFDLNEPSSGEYPFLDTFRYANESTAINTITVSNNSDGMDYLCNNCDGTTGEILFCDDCGEIIIGDSRYIEIYDKTVCEGCFDNCYETCDDCGVYEKADNILSALGNRNVCENCLKDNYTFCECCETNHWKSDVQYIQSTESNVCNTCLTENYSKCNDCGKYHLITDLHKAFNNNMEVHLCSICLDNKYERCSVCGDYFRKKKLFEFFGSSYCEKCESVIYEKQPLVA